MPDEEPEFEYSKCIRCSASSSFTVLIQFPWLANNDWVCWNCLTAEEIYEMPQEIYEEIARRL